MADSKKCMIIGASPLENNAIFKEFNPKNYYVICADGGYETALKYHIKPDFIVGDFDSCKIKPDKSMKNIRVLPVEKDVTDTMYAAMLGLHRGYRDFILVGCSGGAREDHTMANYNVMFYIATKGGSAVMVDNRNEIFMLRGRKLRISGCKGKTISVFPFGTNSINVSYEGLKYPLTQADLTVGETLMGVSNEIVEDMAEIKVHIGCALVILVK